MISTPGCSHSEVRNESDLRSGEHVDTFVGRGVDQHAGVALPAARREIVHTQHFRHRLVRQRDAQQRPDRGVPRQPARHFRQQPDTGPSGQLTHNRPNLMGHPGGAALITIQDTGDLSPKRRATVHCSTHQAANTDLRHHQPAVEWNVDRGPMMVGMQPRRVHSAARASGRATRRPRPHQDALALVDHILDHQWPLPRKTMAAGTFTSSTGTSCRHQRTATTESGTEPLYFTVPWRTLRVAMEEASYRFNRLRRLVAFRTPSRATRRAEATPGDCGMSRNCLCRDAVRDGGGHGWARRAQRREHLRGQTQNPPCPSEIVVNIVLLCADRRCHRRHHPVE